MSYKPAKPEVQAMGLHFWVAAAVAAAMLSTALIGCGDPAGCPLGGPYCAAPAEPIASSPAPDAGDYADDAPSSSSEGDASSSGSADAASTGAGPAPTWTDIFNQYLTPATCGAGIVCHAKEFSSKSGAYSYVQAHCPISGPHGPMACLKGFGSCTQGMCMEGNMPVTGVISDAGSAAIRTWVASGGQNN